MAPPEGIENSDGGSAPLPKPPPERIAPAKPALEAEHSDGLPEGGAEVRLHELTKTYGPVVAVRDVSATIAAGSFFTLLGPSGSGKTTTLMMVAGFTSPTSGEVFVDGKPMAALPPQRRDLGMVFQSYAVFPHLTVFDNVAFPLQIRKTPRLEILHRAGDALELVRLTGYEGRLPRQLSGGEQQRVALARALVFRPRVLLMDEPLGALDKKLRAHMQLELKHIQRQLRVTVIYVTHDQEEALTMSDRVAVMRGGRIEQVGGPAELYDRPVSRFVADFLGESNFLEAVAVAAEGGERWRCRAAGGLEFSGIAASPLEAGRPVTAAIRPEKLVQAEDAGAAALGSGANGCKGLVEEAIYVGDATRYRVGLGADGAVIVKVTNRVGARPAAAGSPISLAWSPEDTRIFPGASA